MLDSMRRGVANIFAKVLLGLLVIAFALWGIGDYLGRGPSQTGPLATVGKTQITADEFKHAYQLELKALGDKLGRTLTPEQGKLLGVPPRALARLIGMAALDLHANELGVTASDAIVGAVIRSQHPELIDSKAGLAARALDGSDAESSSTADIRIEALVGVLSEALADRQA